MTKLTLGDQVRHETDVEIIQTLQRKGWEVFVPKERPAIPDYDADTQKVEYDKDANTYSVVQLSEEELQQVAANKVDIAEQEALMVEQQAAAEARQAVLDQIAAGYDVDPEGFTLGLEDSDRNAFTQMLTLVQEAKALGLIDDTTPQTITDNTGTKQTVTTLRFRQIMVGYGFYYKTLWDLIG